MSRSYTIAKQDGTLVLLDADRKAFLELRPHYEAGTGPSLLLYRVGGFTPEYLATIRVITIPSLVQRLPLAIRAAKALHAKAIQAAKPAA